LFHFKEKIISLKIQVKYLINPLFVFCHTSGKYNPVPTKLQDFSLPNDKCTDIWQLSTLPTTPAYWRDTPTDFNPFFRCGVSSITNPVGKPLYLFNTALN